MYISPSHVYFTTRPIRPNSTHREDLLWLLTPSNHKRKLLHRFENSDKTVLTARCQVSSPKPAMITQFPPKVAYVIPLESWCQQAGCIGWKACNSHLLGGRSGHLALPPPLQPSRDTLCWDAKLLVVCVSRESVLQGSLLWKCEELRAIRDVLCSRPPGTDRTESWFKQTAYSDLYGTQSIAVVCCGLETSICHIIVLHGAGDVTFARL